jgi:WD40 repeat protein
MGPIAATNTASEGLNSSFLSGRCWCRRRSADKTVGLWDAQTGAVKSGAFEGHKEVVTAVLFSPDGSLLASASQDTKARI